MAAGFYPIVADAGADYQVTVIYEDDMGDPIDLTGYTASAGFGPQPGATQSLLVLTSPPPAGITIPTPTNGQIVLALTNAQTTKLPSGGFYVLDIQEGSIITRLLEGTFTMNPGVPT